MNKANQVEFFKVYRRTFGKLSQGKVDGLVRLLEFMEADPTLSDIRHAAYMLATVKHETADTYAPVREAYWKDEEWRMKNLRYAPWYGRGFVQLTWEANYVKAGDLLNLDLTTDPDVVMEPEIAYRIMTIGMREGWFTGKKMEDYLTDYTTDYRNARRIINGLDKASLVADYADRFEGVLGAACFDSLRGF